jgi:HD-like signal output (HDOD) protein/DNA-binding CsgD family transcriptional regulator
MARTKANPKKQPAKAARRAAASGNSRRGTDAAPRKPRSAGAGQGGAASGAPLGARGAGRGGHRLADAFEAVERLPALAESRQRLERLIAKGAASLDDISDTVESDAALAIAVLRGAAAANRGRARIGGVPAAVEVLTPQGVGIATNALDTYEFFESVGRWHGTLERFRRHGVATRHAVERIAALARLPSADELALAALLHDVGRLVLVQLYPGYGELLASRASPQERVQAERRELGVDHALVGGVLVRRWGLAPQVGSAIERHHAQDPDEMAAAVGLADLIAHHSNGDPIPPDRLDALATRCGLGADKVRTLLYEFPYVSPQRRRSSEPCPLSGRELDALRGLADGKVYKEIAEELELSASTVRTHLHNVYRKIGAVDRAQAVLIARDRNWI